jgi:hypothetical protein
VERSGIEGLGINFVEEPKPRLLRSTMAGQSLDIQG